MSYSSPIGDETSRIPSNSTPEAEKKVKLPTSSTNFVFANRILKLRTLCVDVFKRQEPDRFEKILLSGKTLFQEDENLLNFKIEMIDVILFYILRFYTNRIHEGAYLYGGAIRDLLNNEKPNDYDVRVHCEDCAINFINKIKLFYPINIIREHYKGCFTICVQHYKHPEIEIKLDITYVTEFSNKHFDISSNMLKIDLSYDAKGHSENRLTSIKNIDPSNVKLMNPLCKLSDVIRNIYCKKFVVLTRHGKSKTCHTTLWKEAVYNIDGEIVDYHNLFLKPQESYQFPNMSLYNEHLNKICESNLNMIEKCDCISRYSEHGRLLLFRIEKFKKRGWTCINEPCDNPNCILTSQELIDAYEAYKVKKRAKEYEEREKKRELLEKEQRYQEKQRQWEEKKLMKTKIRPYIRWNSGYIPGAIGLKTANRDSYNKFVTAHQRKKVKKQLTKNRFFSKEDKKGRSKSGSKSQQIID